MNMLFCILFLQMFLLFLSIMSVYVLAYTVWCTGDIVTCRLHVVFLYGENALYVWCICGMIYNWYNYTCDVYNIRGICWTLVYVYDVIWWICSVVYEDERHNIVHMMSCIYIWCLVYGAFSCTYDVIYALEVVGVVIYALG